MRISSVIGLYFSPTGTTRTLVTAAAEQAAQTLGVPFRLISLNTPAERETVFHFSADTLVIVGAPTYAGRLPNKISPDLRRILHGTNDTTKPHCLFVCKIATDTKQLFYIH